MTRFALLIAAFLLFSTAGPVVGRAPAVPPRWRVRLTFLVLAGMFLSSASLLAAIMLPEVLVARTIRDVRTTCAAAFHDMGGHPFERWRSILAGAALAMLLGRFAWALVACARQTRRARVTADQPRWTLPTGAKVFVLPLGHPEAFSVGGVRGQVVITQGLLGVLDEEERRAVLLHEEWHLKARHHVVLSLAASARAALAPFPPATAAMAAVEQALEESADEYAAARLGSATVVASGISKAALAGLRSPVGVLSLGSGPDIPSRVRRLLAPPHTPAWAPIACVLGVGLFLGVIGATQMIAGFTLLAAAHHLLGFGAAASCPLRGSS